jgi:large subunit ribosomal protein L23
MALLSRKKKTEEKKEVEPKKVSAKATSSSNVSGNFSSVLLRPRITEKGTDLAATVNAYVFDVLKNSTKKSIASAIFEVYKVKPIKIAVVTVAQKKILVRGKWGKKSAGKKAYVYLKKGDKIEFV